jgi:hypothetical protein
MSQKKQKTGLTLMEKISPLVYYAVSFTVGCIDWLIFSYWLKKYMPSRDRASLRWARKLRKTVGSYITWGTQGVSILLTIIWRSRPIRCRSLRTSAEEKLTSGPGIGLDEISTFELGEWK